MFDMLTYRVKSLFSSKDSVFSLLLLILVFYVALCGPGTLKNLTKKIMFFEVFFIAAFYCLYSVNVRAWLSNGFSKFIVCLVFIWLFLVSASFFQYFVLPFDLSSSQIRHSLYRYLAIMVSPLFIIVVASYLSFSKFGVERYLFAIALSVCVIVISFVWLDYKEPLRSASDWFNDVPFGPHIRSITRLSTVGAVCCFALLISCLQKKSRTLFLVLLLTAINVGMLLWTGGRTGIGVVILCIFVLLMSVVRSKCYSVKVYLAGLVFIVGIAAVGVMSISPGQNGLYRLSNVLHEFSQVESLGVEDKTLNKVTSGRWRVWVSAWMQVKQKPYLGFGPLSFNNYLLQDTSDLSQPHNLLIQALVEWGWLGAVVFFVLLASACIYLLRGAGNLISGDASYCAGFLIVFSLSLNSITAGTYIHAQPVFYLCLGFSLLISNKIRQQRNLRSLESHC